MVSSVDRRNISLPTKQAFPGADVVDRTELSSMEAWEVWEMGSSIIVMGKWACGVDMKSDIKGMDKQSTEMSISQESTPASVIGHKVEVPSYLELVARRRMLWKALEKQDHKSWWVGVIAAFSSERSQLMWMLYAENWSQKGHR